MTTDTHTSAVATWMIQTVGKAIGLSILAGIVGGIVGGILAAATELNSVAVIALMSIAAPLTFSAVLYNAEAPRAEVKVEQA